MKKKSKESLQNQRDINKKDFDIDNENNENNSDDEANKSGSDIEIDIKTFPLKITMIGNASVGKTSIIKRYLENKFELNSTEATINALFHSKKIKVDPFTEADLQIWDTAGQERYRSMTKNYLLNANGIFIVFDLCDEKSFNDLDSWLEDIKDTIDENNVIKILVGNKSDLSDIKITNENASKYAKEHDMKYLSVSAKDGVNIESLFEIMGNDCIRRIQDEQKRNEEEGALNENGQRITGLSGQFENNINIGNNNDNDGDKKNKKCC